MVVVLLPIVVVFGKKSPRPDFGPRSKRGNSPASRKSSCSLTKNANMLQTRVFLYQSISIQKENLVCQTA
jgi:hypothetical protein